MTPTDALGFLVGISGKNRRQFSMAIGKDGSYASAIASRDDWTDVGCETMAKAAAAVGWELRLVDPNGRDYVTIGEPATTLPHPVTSGIELPQDANYTIG